VRFYRPTDATDTRDQPREAPSQRQSRPVRKGLTGRKKGARARLIVQSGTNSAAPLCCWLMKRSNIIDQPREIFQHHCSTAVNSWSICYLVYYPLVAHTNVQTVLNFIIFELTYVAYWFWHTGCFDGVTLYVAGRHLTVVKHCKELMSIVVNINF
jgi:hypothetical protein